MVRRSRGRNAKVEAKKDVVKSKAISIKILVVGLISVLFFVFAQETKGANTSDPSPTSEQVEQQVNKKIDALYKASIKNKNAADRWAHKRATHSQHRIGNKTKSVPYEEYRLKLWKKRRNAQYLAYKRYRAHRLNDLKSCHKAGMPRWYCPILLNVATKQHVKRWAFSPSLAFIISHESGFNPHADNPQSTAYGLFQMLSERSSNPAVQTKNGLRYIKSRYGSPEAAESFWHSHHWY